MRGIVSRGWRGIGRAALAATAAGLIARAAEPLTPEDAVARALARHPLLRAAGAEVEASRADERVARSGYLPRVDLSEDVVRSTNPVFVFGAKLGQQRFAPSDFAIDTLNEPDAYTNAATRVTLRQSVWDGGGTSSGRRATARGREAAEASHDRTRERVALSALQAYWDAVLADAMLTVARAGESAAASNAQAAAARVDQGLGVPSDAMQAEVRLAEVRAQRVAAEQWIVVARARLRQAMGDAPDARYDLMPPEVIPRDPGGSAPDLAGALARRPDLRAAAARVDQADAAASTARARRLPQIGVQAAYEWNGRHPFGSDGSNWTVGAGVTISIFDGTEHGSREARARADRDRALALKDALIDGTRLEIEAAEAALVGSAERLLTAEAALETAAEALRIVRERYEEGLTVITELLGAEAALTQARGARAQAAHDLAVAQAEERFALGLSLAEPSPRDEE